MFYVSRVGGGGGFSDGGGASFLSGEGAPWGDIGFGEGEQFQKVVRWVGHRAPRHTHTLWETLIPGGNFGT